MDKYTMIKSLVSIARQVICS